MNIGDKIKYYRTIRGISQKTLAQHSGVSEGAIRKYESGERNPKPPQLTAIANAFGISDNVFFELIMDTPSSLLPILYQIDELYDISFDGVRDEKGNIDPETLTLHFNNSELNKLLSKWAIAKRAVTVTTRDNYDSDEVYEATLKYMKGMYEDIKGRLMDSQLVLTEKELNAKLEKNSPK